MECQIFGTCPNVRVQRVFGREVGYMQLCDRTARDVTVVPSNKPLLPYTCTESGAGKRQPHILLTLTLGHLLVVPQRWVRYLLYPNFGSATCYTPNYESATCCTPTMGQVSAVPQRWVRYLLLPTMGQLYAGYQTTI